MSILLQQMIEAAEQEMPALHKASLRCAQQNHVNNQIVKQIILFVFILVSYLVSFSQTKEQEAKGQECKTNWKFRQFKQSIKGEVLYHRKALALCGKVSTASVTIIQTKNRNIIRVLEMCNTEKDFEKGAIVKIIPEGDKTWKAELVPFDPQACVTNETYFGKISHN